MIVGGCRVADALIAEVMDILYEGLDLLTNDTLANRAMLALKLVTRQGFLKHGNKWAISGKKDGPSLAKCAAARGDIQTDKGLAGTWYAGHEDDGLLAPGSGVLDDLLYHS